MRMDSFMFEVTDGFNPVYRTFRIAISDVDNKIPIVTIGTIQMKEGAVKIITPFELKGGAGLVFCRKFSHGAKDSALRAKDSTKIRIKSTAMTRACS